MSTNSFLLKNMEKWANFVFWSSKSGKRHDDMSNFRLIIGKLAVSTCHFPELRILKPIFYVLRLFFLVGGSICFWSKNRNEFLGENLKVFYTPKNQYQMYIIICIMLGWRFFNSDLILFLNHFEQCLNSPCGWNDTN